MVRGARRFREDESCDIAEGYGGNSGPIRRQRKSEGTTSFKLMAHSEQTETLEPSASNSFSALFQADDSPHQAVYGPSSPLSDLPYVPSPCYQCNDLRTVQVSDPVYDTLDDLLVHVLRDHEGPSRWIAAKCPWTGCQTKCTFDTLNIWLDHVRIVHQKAFYCEREDCKIRRGGPNPKPFGSQADLNRHSLIKHLPPRLCGKPGCPGKENLNRIDKRTKHILEYHGQFLCTVDGCIRGRQIGNDYYGFATNDKLAQHRRKKHWLLDDMFPDYGTTSRDSHHEDNSKPQTPIETLQLPESPRSLISDETWVDSGYGSQYGDKEESPPPPYPTDLGRSASRKVGSYPEGVEAWCRSQSTMASGVSPDPSSLTFANYQASTIDQPSELTKGPGLLRIMFSRPPTVGKLT
ncbi:uncharacterized protein PAC_08492 [Phialocephala subalpina]|uniref:C2H2-type domain-containing protein n=1 Tax=Phialocephala subalpina TaxID=576137 RepID=A0A1L7X0R5_9HELO|nr:uncharacterized protein PAC_08492 [Phialocephala subalpina]